MINDLHAPQTYRDVNIPDVFAETKAQRAIYDMFYLNATASSANYDQRIKAVGLLEEHFIIDSRSKGVYLGFVDSRGLPAYILLDELEETQTLDYSKEYSTGVKGHRFAAFNFEVDGIPQDIPSEFEAVPRIDSKPLQAFQRR